MKTRAVIFDLFGTLIANYDRDDYYVIIENMGEAVGADPVEFRTIWREHYVDRLTGVHASETANIEWVCNQLKLTPSEEEVARSNEIYLDWALPCLMNPREGSESMLAFLKSQGIKTGMLSDCGPWVAHNWQHSPFARLIGAPVYSSNAGVKKPNASFYKIVLQELDEEPENCIYVADGNGRELEVAENLGMRAIRIEPWNSPDSTPDADFSIPWHGEKIDDLSELLNLLD